MAQATAIFDAKRDRELIAAGTHFWCETCLIAKPLGEQSPDSRYCQGCHDFLLREAETLDPSRKPSWIPRPQKTSGNMCQTPPSQNLAQKTAVAAHNKGTLIVPSVASTKNKRVKKPLQLALPIPGGGEERGASAPLRRAKLSKLSSKNRARAK